MNSKFNVYLLFSQESNNLSDNVLGLGNRHQVSAPIKLDASKSNGPMFLKVRSFHFRFQSLR